MSFSKRPSPMPCWATIGTAALDNVALPVGFTGDMIFAECDTDPAALARTDAAVRRLNAEGRRVWLSRPRCDDPAFGKGADWNDVLMGEAG